MCDATRDAIYCAYQLNSASDVAREAFEDAVQYFSDELTKDSKKRVWLKDYSSINEIHKLVCDMRERYNGSASNKKRVQKWVRKFASHIMQYGMVLDTLAQHHPEYVALAWGIVKFVFMVSNNSAIKSYHSPETVSLPKQNVLDPVIMYNVCFIG
jgi:hypothetical protein